MPDKGKWLITVEATWHLFGNDYIKKVKYVMECLLLD